MCERDAHNISGDLFGSLVILENFFFYELRRRGVSYLMARAHTGAYFIYEYGLIS